MRPGSLSAVPDRPLRPTLVDQVCQGWPDAPVPVLRALQDTEDALARIARAVGLDPATSPEAVAAVVEARMGVSRG